MEEHIVYLGLGSNLGNRLSNLKAAVSQFSPQLRVLDVSQVYETPPWGFTDQPHFLNQAVKAATYESAQALLQHLKRLEIALGRQPGFKNGPRKIDIDILMYDDLVVSTPPLVLPHDQIQNRAFVLVPLNDLAPDLRHPVLKKTVRELLAAVDSSQIKVHVREAREKASPVAEEEHDGTETA